LQIEYKKENRSDFKERKCYSLSRYVQLNFIKIFRVIRVIHILRAGGRREREKERGREGGSNGV
jgi:hypothetical protein